MKPPKEVRDRQLCLYFSEREKEELDHLCDYYYNSSRADFVRIAMFIATFNPSVFMDAAMKAMDEGYLTMAKTRRR